MATGAICAPIPDSLWTKTGTYDIYNKYSSNGGRVGIGCTPASATLLDVNGNVNCGSATTSNITIYGGTWGGSRCNCTLNMGAYSGAFGGRGGSGAWQFLVDSGAANMAIYHSWGSQQLTMFFQRSTGNVGIGNTNPLGNLEVSSATSANPVVRISGFCNDDNAHGYLSFQASKSGVVGTLATTVSGTVLGVIDGNGVNPNSTRANAARIMVCSGWIRRLNNLIPGRISFWTGTNAAAPAEAMRITSTGAVCVGTANAGSPT